MKRALLVVAALALVPGAVRADDSISERVARGVRRRLSRRRRRDRAMVPAPIPDITMLTTQPIPQTLALGYGWRDVPIRHTWRFHSGTDFPAIMHCRARRRFGKVIFAGRYAGYGRCRSITATGDHALAICAASRPRRARSSRPAMASVRSARPAVRRPAPALREVRLDNRPVDPVAAMSIAEIWRSSPMAGRIAAYQLMPDQPEEAARVQRSPRRSAIEGPAAGTPWPHEADEVLW